MQNKIISQNFIKLKILMILKLMISNIFFQIFIKKSHRQVD